MSTADLSAWFKKRPRWLQRAVKELLEKDPLANKDIIDLAELCRKEAVDGAGEIEYVFPDNAFKSTTSDALRLRSIGDVQDINALAPRKPLDFGESNLAVIYGQNGSGKSGYVRILKHTCGARYPGTLHSNIYSSESSIQQCSISYEKNGAVISYQWQADSGVIEDLRSVDIFDASCDQVYITNEDEVTYEPPALSFFSSLISVCEKVSQILDAEAVKLVSEKPALPGDYVATVSGKWYANLSKDLTVNNTAKYCGWTNEDKKELEQLDKRLSEQVPGDKAKQLRTRKQHTDDLIKDTKELIEKLSDENCWRILAAKKQFLLKHKAAKTAAEQFSNDTPLKGVGSDVWKLLWEQARKYSQEQAYKEKTFPCIEEDARCVLCQQQLPKEARKRLQSFEDFVKGEMQKDVEAAKKEFDDAIESVGELPSNESVATKVDAAGLTNEQDAIKGFYTALRNRKDKLLAKVDSVEEVDATERGITVLPEYKEWIEKSRDISSSYDELAQKYEEDAKQNNRAEIISKRLELRARKWLSQQRKSVEDEINRLKQVDALLAAKRLTDTTGLSRKKGELAEELITEAFVKRFESELKKLGADRIKIELTKTRVDKGRVLHRLQLQNAGNGVPEDVLSEGEHRIVSLAAFLADVAEKQNLAPFVFDDPISSLDQDFEEAVVQRLVDLSKERQVIVFTHRLSLLGLIQEYANKTGREPKVVCVRQEAWGAGEPGDTPLFAKKPERALNALLNDRLPKARKVLNEEGRERYVPIAKSICIDYRILLERMIECDLLADVVQRYRRAMKTMGKINKLARITDTDCKFFDDMMTKYSRYEHPQPDEAPVALPAPDELQQDMEALKNWRDEFLKRESP